MVAFVSHYVYRWELKKETVFTFAPVLDTHHGTTSFIKLNKFRQVLFNSLRKPWTKDTLQKVPTCIKLRLPDLPITMQESSLVSLLMSTSFNDALLLTV